MVHFGTPSPGALRAIYRPLSLLPGGRLLFSKLIGFAAPYTGTIGLRVLEVGEGYAHLQMRDRWSVRNHLQSVHAVALMNLGEAVTGLAMSFGMPDGTRGIVTRLSMDYIKKARGTLTAVSRCQPPQTTERREYEVSGEIFNSKGELVARAHATWLIGPAA